MPVKHYRFIVTTSGLVHIGNGQKYSKTDYFIDGRQIAILDVPRFVSMLDKEQFESYRSFLENGISLMNKRQVGLEEFLKQDKHLRDIAKESIAYKLDTELSKTRRGTYQYLDAAEFVKDPYGCPYVPGSSLKGSLRTALLTYFIDNDTEEYAKLYDERLARSARNRDRTKADDPIVNKAFKRKIIGSSEADDLSDIMRFVSVSDSKPLSPNDLVFAKKFDKFSIRDDGSHKKKLGNLSGADYYVGNSLNIYRECLKPGTSIEFNVDIDDRIEGYLDGLVLDAEGIRKVFESFFASYERCFLNSYESIEGKEEGAADASMSVEGQCRYIIQGGPFKGERCRNQALGASGYCRTHSGEASSAEDVSSSNAVPCYLGGGVDFDSKTVINVLFSNDAERLNEISRIMYSQFPTKLSYRDHGALRERIRSEGFDPENFKPKKKKQRKEDHRHWMDFDLGVSPHTLKLGEWSGKKYLMGRCELRIEEY